MMLKGKPLKNTMAHTAKIPFAVTRFAVTHSVVVEHCGVLGRGAPSPERWHTM